MASTQNILYAWQFEDTKHRSPTWYILALAIVIWLVIWWVLTRQYGMSIVVMLWVWFFYFLENNSEDTVRVVITELGIWVQDNFYDYSRIASYSLVYDGSTAIYLRLKLKKKWISFANISIDNATATELRSILPNYIEESDKQELTAVEKISHYLKI